MRLHAPLPGTAPLAWLALALMVVAAGAGGAGPVTSTPAAPADDDLGATSVERTLLSWRRTALSLVAAGLLVGHLAARRTGAPALAVTLLGISAVVAFVWLGRGQRIAATGLALVLGVLLLGSVALVGVVPAERTGRRSRGNDLSLM